MDAFLERRMKDGRYRLNTRMPAPATAVTSWYETPEFANASRGTSVLLGGPVRANAAKPFSEAKKKELETATRRMAADGGPCWSDYERTPGTEAGEKDRAAPRRRRRKRRPRKRPRAKPRPTECATCTVLYSRY